MQSAGDVHARLLEVAAWPARTLWIIAMVRIIAMARLPATTISSPFQSGSINVMGGRLRGCGGLALGHGCQWVLL